MQTTLPLNEHDGLEHVNAAINMFIINIEIYEAPGLHRWMTRNLPHLPVHSVAAAPPRTDTEAKNNTWFKVRPVALTLLQSVNTYCRF